MSLTKFLDDPHMKRQLAAAFPKPKLTVSGGLLAPPLSTKPTLVGTAVDYLLRFHAAHKNTATCVERTLVAAAAPRRLEKKSAPRWILEMAETALADAVEHQQAIKMTGAVSRAAALNALRLAQLDSVCRTTLYEERWFEAPNDADIDDVSQIAALFAAQAWLVAKTSCLLNPTFPVTPTVILGADADLVIDDMIIEIKTTKNLELTRDSYNQLLGYAMLERVGGVGPPDVPRPPTTRIGVYFARHGLLAAWQLDAVANKKQFMSLVNWCRGAVEHDKQGELLAQRALAGARAAPELTATNPFARVAPGPFTYLPRRS